jgi:hypothetical protein
MTARADGGKDEKLLSVDSPKPNSRRIEFRRMQLRKKKESGVGPPHYNVPSPPLGFSANECRLSPGRPLE